MMNWHNLSETEFDTQIKRHLDDSDVAFDPSSWDKMGKKLDLVFPGSGSNSRLFELLLIALFLSGLFFYNVGTFPSSNGDLILSSVNPDKALDYQPDKKNNSTENSPNSITRSKTIKDQNPSTSALAEQNTDPNSSATVGSTLGRSNEAKIESPSKKNQVSAPLNQDRLNQDRQITSAQDQRVNQREDQVTSSDDRPDKAGSSSNEGLPGSNQTRMDLTSNGFHLDRIVEETFPDSLETIQSEGEEVLPIINEKTSRWSVGLGYAPDISLVGFSEVTKPGTNLGLMVEYRLGGRWSLQSGIAYSVKNYKAAGEDYTPPKGFWYYGVAPLSTDATCDVIDIPINLRYYLNPTKNHRFFASTGLSTYLMLTEDYDYKYESQNPNLLQSWSVRNENQHFLGIYNLSMGYQTGIGGRWLVEIEPFIKIPLSGVGFGSVNLWSTGSSFSLKYSFR